MNLSVIIACLNEEKIIGCQLEALTSQQWNQAWEIIISDNGSTDKTLEIANSFSNKFKNLRIVDASDKKGQPHALNIGAANAKSEVLAFCDADDEVCPGWVAAMGEALKTCHFVAGPFEMKKLNPRGLMTTHPQEKGIAKLRNPPYLPHAGSGNMGIQKAIFKKLGGFDESMPCLFDTDFCFKAQLAGYKLEFVPEAVLHVRRPENIRQIFHKSKSYATNHVLLYKRYRQFGMPQISFRDGVTAWKNIIRGSMELRTKAALARWIWKIGWRLGWIKGCFKHNVPGVLLGPQ